jgi:hypothetical protein
MRLVFLYGPPAGGKLTVGTEVARRSGYALFHNHLVTDALLAVFRFGSPEFVALREKFWIETIEAAAQSGRSLVFTFCPEPTVAAGFPERVEAVVRQAGGAVTFVRLEVSAEEQERRLVSPSRKGTKLKRVEVLRAWREDFAAAMAGMPEPALSIDTTATTAEAAANQILQLLD